MIKKIILLLVSILYTFSGTIDIFLTNNQASAVSDYSFSILQESEVTIPSGSEIKIIFPI